MGSGISKLYFNTYGSRSLPGSINFMNSDDKFSEYITKWKDIDQNSYLDVIAHCSALSIQITHNGKRITINHRIAAKLIKNWFCTKFS